MTPLERQEQRALARQFRRQDQARSRFAEIASLPAPATYVTRNTQTAYREVTTKDGGKEFARYNSNALPGGTLPSYDRASLGIPGRLNARPAG